MLSAILTTLIWLAAVAVVALAAALLTPIRLGIMAQSAPRWRLVVAARLYGGLAPAIAIVDTARQSRKRPPQTKPKARSKPRATWSRWGGRRARRLAAGVPAYLADLLRIVRVERLKVDADVGLGDPASTGQLFGLLAAANSARPNSSVLDVNVRPDFMDVRATGELNLDLRFMPVALVLPSARLVWAGFRVGRDD